MARDMRVCFRMQENLFEHLAQESSNRGFRTLSYSHVYTLYVYIFGRLSFYVLYVKALS